MSQPWINDKCGSTELAEVKMINARQSKLVKASHSHGHFTGQGHLGAPRALSRSNEGK